jgi:hypothetical protein
LSMVICSNRKITYDLRAMSYSDKGNHFVAVPKLVLLYLSIPFCETLPPLPIPKRNKHLLGFIIVASHDKQIRITSVIHLSHSF